MNVDTHPSLAVMSLCAGVAGIDLGLGLAIEGARTVLFVENEVSAIEKLVARMEDETLAQAPVWTNLKTFDGRPWRGRVDILTAGYPCQPFSCAGLQRGVKDPRHLWPDVARIIREVEPGCVFLENVENHLRIGYELVRGELLALGYQVEEGIFSAEEVGASHLRKRLFILAYKLGNAARYLQRWDWAESSNPRIEDRRPGSELEDAARHGQHGSLRQDGGRRRGIREAGHGVADTRNGLFPIARGGSSRRTGTGSAGAQLADTQNDHRGRQLETQGTQASQRSDRRRRPAGSHPLFPPGPDDVAAWRELLRFDPTLEPALRGTSNGPSGRVARLRQCGNAVVPLVAAFAFRSLARVALAREPAIMTRAA